MKLAVGQKACREMEVTEGMVRAYAEITGDYNPLHFDADFASRTRFGRPIAQGGITTDLLHALVAMDMPGAGSVFVDRKWCFPRPVYIGDTIQAEATVASVDEDRPVAAVAFVVKNRREEEVLHGEATVYRSEPVGP